MTRLIGIDCATDARRTGLALGRWCTPGIEVLATARPAHRQDQLDTLAAWLQTDETVLLGMDAPLGWPLGLARALQDHHAGSPVPGAANELFRRQTDRSIQQRLRKRPMDVGADRIARTAHAALALLGELAARIARPIEPAWAPDHPPSPGVVEVYPAATLTALGLDARGYKGAARARREALLDGLGGTLNVPGHLSKSALDSDHVLDALICLVAAGDFLDGRCPGPPEPAIARREGWIWVREAATGTTGDD